MQLRLILHTAKYWRLFEQYRSSWGQIGKFTDQASRA